MEDQAPPQTYGSKIAESIGNGLGSIRDRYNEMAEKSSLAELTPEQQTALQNEQGDLAQLEGAAKIRNMQTLEQQAPVEAPVNSADMANTANLLLPQAMKSPPIDSSARGVYHGENPLDTSKFPVDTRNKNAPTEASPLGLAADGYAEQLKGIKTAEDATIARATAEATEQKAKQDILKNQAAEQAARSLKITAAGDNAVKQYELAQGEINNFKFTDYWADKSTGSKVMAGIALALGGIGGSYAGKGDNKALDVINKAIDQDLELQKLNYKRLGDKSDGVKSLYGMYMTKYNNEALASDATSATLLKAAQGRLDSIGSQYDNKMTQGKLQMMRGQLQEQQQQKLVAVKQNAMASALLNGNSTELKNLTPQEVHNLGEATGDKTLGERFVSGYGPAMNKEKAKEFETYRATTEPAIQGAQRILAASKDLNRVTDIKKKAQISSEMKALAGQLRVPFTGPGALTEKEYDRLMETLGDPASLTSMPSVQRVRLETVLKKLNTDMAINARNAGLQPAVQDATPYRHFGKK